MTEGGEKKRKTGLDLDFDQLLSRDNEPPPELMIVDASEKSMPTEDVEVVDPQFGNYVKITDKDLIDKISRSRNFLQIGTLADGGTKLRARLKAMEAELARRKLLKDDKKCKKVTTLGDESTCNGPIYDLSQPRAPPSKPVSEFSLRFCTMMDKNATGSFREELSTLNRFDHVKTRDHNPFSAQITHKKGLSSRQAPFKSPNLFPVNVDNQQQTNCEQRGSHDFNPSSHWSDRDASCCSSKKESGAHSHSLRPLNSRRNTRKTVVLVDEEEEELEVDVVDETDLAGQSSTGTRIYYPSRDDPKSVQICYSDMKCLYPESYLSSPIMNFYIRYLQKPTSPSARTERDFLIFNTYFYEKLKQDVLTKIETEREALFVKFRRWWKGVNVFEKAYIFLPIHENQHWSLVIICMPNKEDDSGPIILHLDSFGLHISKSIFSNVKSFLIEEWKFLRQEEVLPELPMAENIWKRLSRRINEKVIEVPQQENGYDCGLFVLFFMERFIDEAPERLKNRDLEMFGKHWFKPEEASSLRTKLRNLLKDEFQNAKENACKLDS